MENVEAYLSATLQLFTMIFCLISFSEFGRANGTFRTAAESMLAENSFLTSNDHDEWIRLVLQNQGLGGSAPTLRHVLLLSPKIILEKLTDPSFPKIPTNVSVFDSAEDTLKWWSIHLARKGLHFGMTSDEIRRFEENPNGVEFQDLKDFHKGVGGAVASELHAYGLFTSGQLLQAVPEGQPASRYFVLSTTTKNRNLQIKLDNLRSALKQERTNQIAFSNSLASSASPELKAFVTLHRMEGVEGLFALTEEELLHLRGLNLKLAHELYGLAVKYGLRFTPLSCIGLFQ